MRGFTSLRPTGVVTGSIWQFSNGADADSTTRARTVLGRFQTVDDGGLVGQEVAVCGLGCFVHTHQLVGYSRRYRSTGCRHSGIRIDRSGDYIIRKSEPFLLEFISRFLHSATELLMALKMRTVAQGGRKNKGLLFLHDPAQ